VLPTRYRLYGLIVETHLPLPGIDQVRRSSGRRRTAGLESDNARPFDVRLCPGESSRFSNARERLQLPSTAKDWFECRRLTDGTTYMRWAGLFEFLVAPEGRTIEYRRLRHATDESLATYLLGQVLSFSLLSFGYDPLHATAVVIGGKAVAFLGDCGYGKSTLGAAFVARGFPILTDDVLALRAQDGGWMAYPGPRRLKLFPSVAHRVLARASGRRLNPDTSKLVVRLADREALSRAVPVGTLYALGDPAKRRGRHPAPVRIAPLDGPNAFLEVTRSAFNLLRVDRERLERHFTITSRLVREVPLKRLTYPRSLGSLGAVCDAVLNDL
jgi:hypothetical protein